MIRQPDGRPEPVESEYVPADKIQLLYFTPSDLLIPRVDRQCIMRFCEAVAELDVEVEAVSLGVRLEYDEPTRTRALFDVYGTRTPFKVTVLPSRTRQSKDNVSGIWRALAYSSYAFWQLVVRKRAFIHDCTIVYFKNYLLAIPFLIAKGLLRGRLVLLFEAHVPPARRVGRALLQHLDGVIPVSHILARELAEDHDIDPDRILVAHMGVNLGRVDEVRVEKDEARHRLGLLLDRKLVVYTGKVHAKSGEINLLLQTAKLLQPDIEFVIVGGRQDQVEALRERTRREGTKNVLFPGFVAPADVFHYQMAADVLVSYYPGDIPLNKYRASPGKLFEYMASGRPIVTADYPALREALSPGAALFVEKDDPEQLAAGIERVLADEALAKRLSRQAYSDVAEFTWQRRAERVLGFVERLRRCEAPSTARPAAHIERASR